jgi:hypothetical protein
MSKERKNRDLKEVAERLQEQVLDGWEGVAADVAWDFDLTDAQAKRVIEYAKRWFADAGISWGFDYKGSRRFVLAGSDDFAGQRRLYEGAVEHLAASTKMIAPAITAFYHADFITGGEADRKHEQIKTIRKDILKLQKTNFKTSRA